MANFPSKQLDQFTVRFPDGLRDRIKEAAEANNRSMNAEIVATLEKEYPAPNNIERTLDLAFERISEAVSNLGWSEINEPAIQGIAARTSLGLGLDLTAFKASFDGNIIKVSSQIPNYSGYKLVMVRPEPINVGLIKKQK